MMLLPRIKLTNETFTNTSTSQPLLGNHTIESLSNLSVSELLNFNTYDQFQGPQPGDISVRRLFLDVVHPY